MLKEIYHLLLPSERRMGMRVIMAVFFSALLNFAGLAALIPVLLFLIEEKEEKGEALLFCLLAVGFILFKNVLVMGLSRFQNYFLLSLYKRLSFSLFSSYYHRGLLFISRLGSTRLGYEVNYVCYAFSMSLLSPLLNMTADVLLILLVTAVLLVYAPMTVLMLYLAFFPFMLMYIFGIKRRIRYYGKKELLARREQTRIVTEAYKGYAELEVNHAFPSLQHSFLKGLDTISFCRLKLETVYHLPLCLSELSVVIGLTLLALSGTGNVKALVGIFAVGAFRLLPALRELLSAWTQIQNSVFCLRIIKAGMEDLFSTFEEKPTAGLSFEKEIAISNLSYAYPEGKRVLKEFDCMIRKGEYIGIRGSSGIGKSTLFNLLLGFLKPDGGEIRIDGVLLSAENRKLWHRRIGYVPQGVFILDGTLAENVALGCCDISKEKVKRILRQVRLDEWVDELPLGIDTLLGESGARLSGGQKQRVGIARALYKEADILLLDEATSALDTATECEINEMICGLRNDYRGLTVLSIAHRESSLAFCNRIITLN
ncbi:ABC transporter ATP-binding protein [Phocaeicola massiliensis]|jgi:ABC-type multidrug transport system fused ATPase/permease subunit|uniref:ABC transporter ATP-binding protein n=1 Tax=Phocaeicola massiliensis TaxID=204516 RepID=UPI000E3F2DFF|nr:ABC transporter ATP-binding protein [Phocaeicola massiliensis]RGF14187.1 ABC transporter ATP-binding protein [Bacteroides sp. AM16-15]